MTSLLILNNRPLFELYTLYSPAIFWTHVLNSIYILYEPRSGKTGVLHMRKQKHRVTAQLTRAIVFAS